MLKKLNAPSAALAAAALVASCGGEPEAPRAQFRQQSQSLPAVEAVEVAYGSFPLEERLSGSVRARNQTEIYAEAAGTIEAVYVDDGDSVSAGDPLVQLRARDFQERVRQAESGLQVAEARVRTISIPIAPAWKGASAARSIAAPSTTSKPASPTSTARAMGPST
jgi:multidrug efflux pump subunit AcrA (membrane-fusion protein)